MSTYERVWGVEIRLDGRYTQDTSIGLYTPTVGNSEIRLIECDVPDLATQMGEEWKSGLIVEFGSLKESVDLKSGGNKSIIESTHVIVSNVDQYNVELANADIKILNRNALIWEFQREVSTGIITPYILREGVCDDPTFNETRYRIPIKDLNFKRNAPIGTLINEENFPHATSEIIGKMIPETIGEFRPETSSYETFAQMVRVSDAEDNMQTASEINFGHIHTGVPDIEVFAKFYATKEYGNPCYPVVGNDGDVPPVMYKIKLSAGVVEWYHKENREPLEPIITGPIISGPVALNALVGKYIKIIEGTCEGSYRQITAAEVDTAVDTTVINVTVQDVFKEILAGDANANAEDQSWVCIVDIYQAYRASMRKCIGFTDSEGNVLTNRLELYGYASEKKAKVTTTNTDAIVEEKPIAFIRIPEFAYKISDLNESNSFEIAVSQVDGDPGQIKGFVFLPIRDFKPYDGDNLVYIDGHSEYTKYTEGIFFHSGSTVIDGDVLVEGSIAAITDKIEEHADSFYRYGLQNYTSSSAGTSDYMVVFSFLPPSCPNFEFDKVYLCVDIIDIGGGINSAITQRATFLLYRRFYGGIKAINRSGDLWAGGALRSMPDFYYTNQPSYNNKYFYFNNNLDAHDNIYGYERYELQDVNGKDTYNAIHEIFAAFNRHCEGTLGASSSVRICEIAMAFEKKVSIKNEIYSAFKGWVYADTWGGRKTAVNMIDNPIDALEAILRSQDWSETGATPPAGGWGKGFSSSAKIDVSSNYGGLEHVSLSSLKNIKCAHQILDYNKSYTENIIKSICKEFFLCQFKKHYSTPASGDSGKECVTFLFNNVEPDITITQAHIKGDIGEIIGPQSEDIYCEPYVKFCYNPARNDFDKIIQIKNVAASSFDKSYTAGFSGNEGEYFWNKCKSLYDKYKIITPPSDDMTNLHWCYSYAYAKQYLDWWIRWMQLKRIEFSVPYELGRTWHITKKVYINLMHQTNSIDCQAMIETIEKSKNSNEVKCTFVLLDMVSNIDFYIQDTYNTVETNWQDTFDETNTIYQDMT